MYRYICLAVFVFLSSSCSQEAYFEKFVPQEESSLAKELVAKLSAKDFVYVESRLDSKLKTLELRGKLEELAKLLPAGEPKSIRTVGANTNRSGASTIYNLAYEYEYSEGWVLADVVVERRDGRIIGQGIHLFPNKESFATTNRFTFEGKGTAHYVVLALAIAIPLFVVYALAVCVRTKIPKRKWLWLLFVALGVGQFHFNWSNGARGVQPVSFSLIGAGFTKAGPVAPYILTLAFPLGAIVFLARRRSIQNSQEQPQA